MVLSDIRQIRRYHPSAVIISSDVSDYTVVADQTDPVQLVSSLHELFCRFDRLAKKYGIVKVKTVGDGYLACAGLFDNFEKGQNNQGSAILAQNALSFALDMLEEVSEHNAAHPNERKISIRVDMHCGKVLSGVVGHSKIQFDIF